jgi:hypothetical protein
MYEHSDEGRARLAKIAEDGALLERLVAALELAREAFWEM